MTVYKFESYSFDEMNQLKHCFDSASNYWKGSFKTTLLDTFAPYSWFELTIELNGSIESEFLKLCSALTPLEPEKVL